MSTLALAVVAVLCGDAGRELVAAQGSPFYVGPMAGRPVIGDLNEDGAPDVVVACGTCCGSQPDPKSGHVVVMIGDGEGGFGLASAPVKVGSSVRKIALGDVNEDGHLDVVAAEHETYVVTVLLGDGKGHLRKAPIAPVALTSTKRPHTHEIVLGDVNGDRHLDVLTTNANDNSISLLLGDGTGAFHSAPASPIAAGVHPYDAIVLADVNGDRRPDLITPNLRASKVTVLLNQGEARFTPAPGSPIAVGPRPGYVAVIDADRDQKLDLVVTHDDDPLVYVLLGDGTGRFVAAAGSPITLAQPVWGISAADLSGDGIADLALGSLGKSPIVLLGNGHGGFAGQLPITGVVGDVASYTAVADVDGDELPDLVTGNYQSGDLSVYLLRVKQP